MNLPHRRGSRSNFAMQLSKRQLELRLEPWMDNLAVAQHFRQHSAVRNMVLLPSRLLGRLFLERNSACLPFVSSLSWWIELVSKDSMLQRYNLWVDWKPYSWEGSLISRRTNWLLGEKVLKVIFATLIRCIRGSATFQPGQPDGKQRAYSRMVIRSLAGKRIFSLSLSWKSIQL